MTNYCFKPNSFLVGIFFFALINLSCERNRDCNEFDTDIVSADVPPTGGINSLVKVEVTFKAIWSDDEIIGGRTNVDGLVHEKIFSRSSCDGIRLPRNKTQTVSLIFDQKGEYTILFLSPSEPTIAKTIIIE